MNLDESDVSRLLRLEEVIPAMERALADFSSGTVVQHVRTMLPVAEHQGFLGLMPAYTGSALGAKLVAFYSHNIGVPTHHATILRFRPETGEPLVTVDGRLITEVRTAAVSAVATDRLAKFDASVLAIIGSGVQASSHLEALRLVREFREARMWSPRRAAAFAEEHGIDAATSAEEAVRGADVVVTATTSPTPASRQHQLRNTAQLHPSSSMACKADDVPGKWGQLHLQGTVHFLSVRLGSRPYPIRVFKRIRRIRVLVSQNHVLLDAVTGKCPKVARES